MLCVMRMLLTGFDAPVEQALYLDRRIIEHELLQAIARVNRKRLGKECGYVIDYIGVARELRAALTDSEEGGEGGPVRQRGLMGCAMKFPACVTGIRRPWSFPLSGHPGTDAD